MARPVVFTWPAPSATAIASAQTILAGASFSLDGSTVVTGFGGSYRAASFPGISRTVSITSAGNNAGVNFTITGTYRDAAQSATIAGPNATTVFTTAVFFDTVTSVTVDANTVGAVSIGTGTTGETHWFTHNMHSSVQGFTVQAVRTGTITYSFVTTLDDVQTTSSPTTFQTIATMIAATTSQFAPYNNTSRYSKISITASTDGSLVTTFLQQGID